MHNFTKFNVGVMNMNNKRRIFSALFSLALLLSTVPAWAVTFKSGPTSISRFNTGGSSFVNLTSSATTFCYLSKVGVRDTDSSTEEAGCRLTKGSVVWTLEAYLSQSNDADAACSAICYNN
jgi:hypothetical protein